MPGYDNRFYPMPAYRAREKRRDGETRFGASSNTRSRSYGWTYSFRSNPISCAVMDALPQGQTYKERLIFYREAARAAEASSTLDDVVAAQAPYRNRKLVTSDIGHIFKSAKASSSPIKGSYALERFTEGEWQFYTHSEVSGEPSLPSGCLPGFASADARKAVQGSVLSELRSTFPNDIVQQMFASVVPPSGGVGETVIELLRGDFPSLARKLRVAARDVSKKARTTHYVWAEGLKGPPPLAKQRAVAKALGVPVADLVWSAKGVRKGEAHAARHQRTPSWLKVGKTSVAGMGAQYVGFRFGIEPYIDVFDQLLSLVKRVSPEGYGPRFRRHRRLLISSGNKSVTSRGFGASGTAGINIREQLLKRARESESLRPLVDDGRDFTPVTISGDVPEFGAKAARRLRKRAASGFTWSALLKSGSAPGAIGMALHNGPPVERLVQVSWTEDVRLTVSAGQRVNADTGFYNEDNLVRELGAWTPSLGWDLLPWSWFVDWFANISRAMKTNHFYRERPVSYAYATYRSTVTFIAPAHTSNGWVTQGDRRAKYSLSGYAKSVVYTERRRVDPFTGQLLAVGLRPDAYKTSIMLGLGLAKLK